MPESYNNYYRNELSYIDTDIVNITTGQYYLTNDLFPNITLETVVGRLSIITTPGESASVAIDGELEDYKNLGQVICRNYEGMCNIKEYITDTYQSLGWVRLQPIEAIKDVFKRNIPVKITNKLYIDTLENINQLGAEQSIIREDTDDYYDGNVSANFQTYIYTGGFVTAPEGLGTFNMSAPILDTVGITNVHQSYLRDVARIRPQPYNLTEYITRMFTSDTVANVPWLYFPSLLKIGIRSIIPGNSYMLSLDRFELEHNIEDF